MEFFRGTNKEQDGRWESVDDALLRSVELPAICSAALDWPKVHLPPVKAWVHRRLTEILGFEDEIVIGLVCAYLDEPEGVDPRRLLLQLGGFLEGEAAPFVEHLWIRLHGKAAAAGEAAPGGARGGARPAVSSSEGRTAAPGTRARRSSRFAGQAAAPAAVAVKRERSSAAEGIKPEAAAAAASRRAGSYDGGRQQARRRSRWDDGRAAPAGPRASRWDDPHRDGDRDRDRDRDRGLDRDRDRSRSRERRVERESERAPAAPRRRASRWD